MFDIIEPSSDGEKLSGIYDVFMLIVIAISLVPLCFKTEVPVFNIIDKICVVIFIIDYLARWITADYKFEKKSVVSFIRYPFSFFAIVDLLSILPSLSILAKGFKMFRLFRMIRAFRIFRVVKAFRYSKNVQIIINVIKDSKNSLITVCGFALMYIFVSALIIFNVEPETFNSFFDALYWATVSLTTVGYGDIYPVSDIGRIITMISSVLGIAVIALPASIITAEYVETINKR